MRGIAGEVTFCAVLLLLGCVGLVWSFGSFLWPEWRVNHEFVETTCKVLDKRIVPKQGEEGPLYRPELRLEYTAGPGGPITTWSHYDIHETFFDNRNAAQAVLDRFEAGGRSAKQPYRCWYDPSNPSMVVLSRDYRWWGWLLFTVPVSFVIIGTGGLIHALLRVGRSAERRAALARRASQRRRPKFDDRAPPVFPFVPLGADITNSPGTKLRFRLPVHHSPGWALFGMLVFCVVLNGIVAVMAVWAVRGCRAGRPDWSLILFVVLFLLVGLGAIGVFFRRLMAAMAVGPTRVEISDHPLQPGSRCRVFLSHSGWQALTDLRVSFVCEEIATFRQGTNTRTETREVYRQELLRRHQVEHSKGVPFEADIDLDLPPCIMHSFASRHNEIHWTLVVDGRREGKPDYKRAFPVIVRPAAGDSGP